VATINLGTIGFTFRGVYDAAVTYAKQDIVREGVDTYVSLVDSNTANTPSTSATQWAVFTQGIGQNTGTNNGGVWYFDGTNVVSLAPGSANEVLRIGSSGNPEWAIDDSRSGVRVANLPSGRSQMIYNKYYGVMEDGSLRAWGYNGNYQHGTGSATSSKSYPINVGFPHGFVGCQLDERKLSNRNKTTVTLAVTQGTDSGGNPIFVIDGVDNPNIDMTKGNIYKFDQTDSTNTEDLVFEESTDGGVTWSSLTLSEIGNNDVTSVYTASGLTAGTDRITYLRIGEDETNMYRYVGSTTGSTMGNTITLNTNGFVQYFRHQGGYFFMHYNNATGVIDNSGNVWMWGNNGNGVCGTGSTSHQYTPYNATANATNSLNGKTAKLFGREVGAESNNTCCWVLCTDGSVHHAGYSGHGQTGNGSAATNYFVQMLNVTKVVDIHQSCDNTPFLIMLEANGELKHVGYGGTYGNGSNTNNSSVPLTISAVTQRVAEILYVGRRMTFVRDIDGNCWNWGNDNYGFLARSGTAGNYSAAIVYNNNASGTDCVCEAVGNPDGDTYESSYIRTASGLVKSSGYNGYGQLGNGNTTNATSWQDLTGTVTTYLAHNDFGTFPQGGFPSFSARKIIKLLAMGSGSYGFFICLDDEGAAYGCGYNGNGQLGTGDTTNLNAGQIHRWLVPKKLIDVSVAGYAQYGHTWGLTEDGHLVCSGYNGDSCLTGDDAERQDVHKYVVF
jgi:alpha-tubulin suppressor-like RCC1 family protein